MRCPWGEDDRPSLLQKTVSFWMVFYISFTRAQEEDPNLLNTTFISRFIVCKLTLVFYSARGVGMDVTSFTIPRAPHYRPIPTSPPLQAFVTVLATAVPSASASSAPAASLERMWRISPTAWTTSTVPAAASCSSLSGTSESHPTAFLRNMHSTCDLHLQLHSLYAYE